MEWEKLTDSLWLPRWHVLSHKHSRLMHAEHTDGPPLTREQSFHPTLPPLTRQEGSRNAQLHLPINRLDQSIASSLIAKTCLTTSSILDGTPSSNITFVVRTLHPRIFLAVSIEKSKSTYMSSM